MSNIYSPRMINHSMQIIKMRSIILLTLNFDPSAQLDLIVFLAERAFRGVVEETGNRHYENLGQQPQF